nr:MAG TPA: hypothetical protein [Caudoviricetes sp.]
MRNVRGTQVPRPETLAPQGFQPLFWWGVELWNKKYSIYKSVHIYGRLFE